jgi:hypothetical protein
MSMITTLLLSVAFLFLGSIAWSLRNPQVEVASRHKRVYRYGERIDRKRL